MVRVIIVLKMSWRAKVEVRIYSGRGESLRGEGWPKRGRAIGTPL